jgi:hypothetical protein
VVVRVLFFVIRDKMTINKANLYAFALLFFVMFLVQFRAEADELTEPKPPYSIEQLRAWHKGMGPWPWPGLSEQTVNLRNEKDHELLLAIRGYARGGTFIVFAKLNGAWSQISEEIEQAHHPLNILQTTNNGWHDFETFVPAWGSGGAEVWVFTYSWNGEKYVLKNQKDGKWCDFEPFKTDIKMCPNVSIDNENTR